MAKHRYYVIFVDDFSRKFWILLMQKKDKMFAKFCEVKPLVEKDIGRKFKALRTDNDGYYLSNDSKNYVH